MVTYTTDLGAIEPGQLTGGFFEGWEDPPSPDQHLAIMRGSPHVVLAMDDDRVVGFVTAISDGVRSAFISLLEVLPDHRRRGIGTELVQRMLGELGSMRTIDLTCDPELQPFYEGFGMIRTYGMAIRGYVGGAAGPSS